MRTLLLLSFLLLAPTALIAQFGSPNYASLDTFLTVLEANDKAMGSLVIAKNGKVLYNRTIGFCEVEKNTKPDINTAYGIGSISKTFTAAIVLLLEQSGKLNTQDKLSKYYPKVPNASKITLEQIMRHRSGIFNYTDVDGLSAYMETPQTEAQMLERIVKFKPHSKPGKAYSYSNTNYLLLSYIVQKVSGEAYATLLDKLIVKPLGLQHTYLSDDLITRSDYSMSYGMEKGNWFPGPITHTSVDLGAGGIRSSPKDLTTFYTSLMQGRLLSLASLTKMVDFDNSVGMGVFEIPFYQKKGIGHGGKIDGYSSIASWMIDDSVTVAYITNGEIYPSNDIAIAALSAHYGIKVKIPSFAEVSTSNVDLDKYIGDYTSEVLDLPITVTKVGDKLFAQAKGQDPFPLKYQGEDVFTFDQYGIIVTFTPASNGLDMEQNGQKIPYFKKK